MKAKIRKLLLRSMMLTFPVSAYLWATGMVLIGILYMLPLGNMIPPDIPLINDMIWGVLLTATGSALLYAMAHRKRGMIRHLSFLIATFATTLLIASIQAGRPVATVTSLLTVVYYGYSYLCSHLIDEWRLIEAERLKRLRNHLNM